jgi:hypothetical protein
VDECKPLVVGKKPKKTKDGAMVGARGGGKDGVDCGQSKAYLQQTLHTQQDTQRKLEVRAGAESTRHNLERISFNNLNLRIHTAVHRI